MPKLGEHLGAAYSADKQKWFARISVEGVRKHLGYFATPEEASRAYLEAKGVKAKAKAETAPRASPRPAKPRVCEPGQLSQGVLDDLFPDFELDDAVHFPASLLRPGDITIKNPFEHERLAIWARVSKRYNISLHTASLLSFYHCEDKLFDSDESEAVREARHEARLSPTVARLKSVGLIDRVSEVVEFYEYDDATWLDRAIVTLSGAGDLI
jgi:hypothetical protein